MLFIFGYVVLSIQPWMPMNSLNRGHARTIEHVSHRRLVHDEHGRAALFGRPAFFQFHPAIFLFLAVLLVGFDWLLQFDGNHPRIPRRPASRQFLCRYVAGRGLHVSTRVAGSGRDLYSTGQSHDVRLRPPGLDARTWCHGNERGRHAQSANSRRRPRRGLCHHQAIGHQRRRLLSA